MALKCFSFHGHLAQGLLLESGPEEEKEELNGGLVALFPCGKEGQSLFRSLAEVRMSEFNFACTKCPRTFKLSEFYEKHKKVHELKKQHVCNICGFVYGAAKGLEGHLKTHQESELHAAESKIETPSISSTPPPSTQSSSSQSSSPAQGHGTGNYRVYENIPDVNDGAYQNGIGYFVCELCSREFSGLNSLKKTHAYTWSICSTQINITMDGSKNESVPFKCHICQDVYPEASQLKIHLDSAHTPTKSIFQCDTCPASFVNAKDKNKHMINEHRFGSFFEKLFCSEELTEILSPRPSNGKDSVNRSVVSKATHYFDETKGTQMLSCNLCSDSFLRKNDLWIHLESAHAAVLPVCRVCEDKFLDLAELKEHIELAHGKRKPGPASKTNAHPLSRSGSCQCLECGIILPERLSLSTHMKIVHSTMETDIGSHCELCQKDFPSLLDLEAHQKGKHPNLNKRLQNLRDALFPEPKKMKLETDDEDAHKAETDLIAMNSLQQRPNSSSQEYNQDQLINERDETDFQDDFEEDVQYVPIMEDFYFEDMIIHPCYVVIPFVSDEEIEAACSKSQQCPPIDDFDEDQGQLTIDEGSYDENALESSKNPDTPFTGEQENFNSSPKGYDADDIKGDTPHMGFYPDNISDFSLPFTLSGLWKKKADILGPNAMKQADLLEKQIKKINDYEKRQAEKRVKSESDDGEMSPSEDAPVLTRSHTPDQIPQNNNNYVPHGKPKINLTTSLNDEDIKFDSSPYPSSPGKGHRIKTSPHKAPDANVSKYESQIQHNHWPVECIKCDLQLNDLQFFNIHMNDHWTGDKCCPVCKLLINSKRFNFNKHLKIHTGEKPFVCDICKRSFRQKAHMVKHVTTHRSLPAAQIKVELPAGLSVN
ncbi:KRAB [Lepeophtheirus salmonis]|uniref:KRAB n=1 Tax=Lepeophtheirus salmonis TaxID=72036 RepID=A0A7R8CJN9_LEPSM|nr:KRAB [Lepeophtheirus salmonis]CAF2843491.1 KRAB [Lepeophtheirus salmonis]